MLRAEVRLGVPTHAAAVEEEVAAPKAPAFFFGGQPFYEQPREPLKKEDGGEGGNIILTEEDWAELQLGGRAVNAATTEAASASPLAIHDDAHHEMGHLNTFSAWEDGWVARGVSRGDPLVEQICGVYFCAASPVVVERWYGLRTLREMGHGSQSSLCVEREPPPALRVSVAQNGADVPLRSALGLSSSSSLPPCMSWAAAASGGHDGCHLLPLVHLYALHCPTRISTACAVLLRTLVAHALRWQLFELLVQEMMEQQHVMEPPTIINDALRPYCRFDGDDGDACVVTWSMELMYVLAEHLPLGGHLHRGDVKDDEEGINVSTRWATLLQAATTLKDPRHHHHHHHQDDDDDGHSEAGFSGTEESSLSEGDASHHHLQPPCPQDVVLVPHVVRRTSLCVHQVVWPDTCVVLHRPLRCHATSVEKRHVPATMLPIMCGLLTQLQRSSHARQDERIAASLLSALLHTAILPATQHHRFGNEAFEDDEDAREDYRQCCEAAQAGLTALYTWNMPSPAHVAEVGAERFAEEARRSVMAYINNSNNHCGIGQTPLQIDGRAYINNILCSVALMDGEEEASRRVAASARALPAIQPAIAVAALWSTDSCMVNELWMAMYALHRQLVIGTSNLAQAVWKHHHDERTKEEEGQRRQEEQQQYRDVDVDARAELVEMAVACGKAKQVVMQVLLPCQRLAPARPAQPPPHEERLEPLGEGLRTESTSDIKEGEGEWCLTIFLKLLVRSARLWRLSESVEKYREVRREVVEVLRKWKSYRRNHDDGGGVETAAASVVEQVVVEMDEAKWKAMKNATEQSLLCDTSPWL